MFDLAEPGADPIADEITSERSSGLRGSRRVSTGSWATTNSTASRTTTAAPAELNERVIAGLIVGNSLLTARGVPASGEGDLKTNVAMLLIDRLGAGGSYTEFYALDFDDSFVLMGHDGPGHVAIAEGGRFCARSSSTTASRERGFRSS